MKGAIFLEFINLVDELMGPEFTEKLIESVELPSGGAYTSIGTYECSEMITLVMALSKATDLPADELQKRFGAFLFQRLAERYSIFIDGFTDPFAFLVTLENTIHVEVRKLYPDAELPSFKHERPDDRTLKLVYESPRPLSDVCEGLILGCLDFFNADVTLDREDLPVESGSKAAFTLQKAA